MTTEAPPAGITVYPDEQQNGYVDPRLDYEYINDVGKYVAECLDNGVTVEANFQPGDGTRYALVFAPLAALATAPARHAHTASAWERHAVSGCRANRTVHEFDGAARYYAPSTCLVTWIDQAAYPINLTNSFGTDYIAQKFKTTIVSGCTLAILFRAIAYHSKGTI